MNDNGTMFGAAGTGSLISELGNCKQCDRPTSPAFLSVAEGHCHLCWEFSKECRNAWMGFVNGLCHGLVPVNKKKVAEISIAADLLVEEYKARFAPKRKET